MPEDTSGSPSYQALKLKTGMLFVSRMLLAYTYWYCTDFFKGGRGPAGMSLTPGHGKATQGQLGSAGGGVCLWGKNPRDSLQEEEVPLKGRGLCSLMSRTKATNLPQSGPSRAGRGGAGEDPNVSGMKGRARA